MWTLVESNPDAPSFSPSINIHIADEEYEKHPNMPRKHQRCHYFITNGTIQYCGDCTNPEFAGKVVDLPHLSESTVEYYSQDPETK